MVRKRFPSPKGPKPGEYRHCLKCNKSYELIDCFWQRLESSPRCKKCQAAKNIVNRQKNIVRYREYTREYGKKNRSKNNEACKRYRERHPERRKACVKKWMIENPEKNSKILKRSRDKRRSTPKGIINHRMEVQLSQSLRGGKAGRKWESLVGYTVIDLKNHIENRFTVDMSWDDFNKGLIHIDHIYPKSLLEYNSTDDVNFKICWALKNLRPLFAKDNMIKSDSVEQWQLDLLEEIKNDLGIK